MDIYTASYHYSGPDRLDVTVKGNDPIGSLFAPTWDMVKGFKSGEIDEYGYEKRYRSLMNARYNVSKDAFKFAVSSQRTLVCFCPPGAFCHRVILAEGLENLGATYKGERNIKFESENVYEEGDLMDKTEGFILHQVNCQGVMGAGIAKTIRDRYPGAYENYRAVCKSVSRTGDLLGRAQFVQVSDRLYVINLFGQDRYGRDKRYTNYCKLREALRGASEGIQVIEEMFGLKLPVYVPYRMSCMNAGGDWYLVSKMVRNLLPSAQVIRKG